MTWGNRFKLFFGLLFVTALVFGLTVLFAHRQLQIESNSASIVSGDYGVGSDYAGLVVAQHAQEGDKVEKGDPIFAIESLALRRDIELGAVSAPTVDITADGVLTVRAGVSGTVSALEVREGAYAPAGALLAHIDREGSLTAQAEFILTPRDFGRIDQGATIEILLPDQRVMYGTLVDMNVETLDGVAHVTATIASPDLANANGDPLIKDGTPVQATIHLRDDGPLAGVTESLRDFARRLGF